MDDYVEHQGIKYKYFTGIRTESSEFEEESPTRTHPPRPTVVLEGVTWRSDLGWTEPHDVTIDGAYRLQVYMGPLGG